MKNIKAQKIRRMTSNYLRSTFEEHTPFFMHIAPVRRCNTTCSYCYQYSNTPDMSVEEFKRHVDIYHPKGLSIVSFTGGEPTIWKHLKDAITYCDGKALFTQLTSNGIGLNRHAIHDLHISGLDYLSISIDSVANTQISKKTLKHNLPLLEFAKSLGMLVSSNLVLTKQNCNDLETILKALAQHDIPMSIGIIVPPMNPTNSWNGDIYTFSQTELNEVSELVLSMYNKYNILEPRQYFIDLKMRDKRQAWNCHEASKRSVHVGPSGDVMWCLKLNRNSPFAPDEIVGDKKEKYRQILKSISESCNSDCYSNCAYSSYYYAKHPLKFIGKLVQSSAFS